MKTLYLDIFSGISGDMFLGALLDLGVDFRKLELELQKLGLGGYHLHAVAGQKNQITGTQFQVHLEAVHGHAHNHNHDLDPTHDLPQAHDQDHGHRHDHDHGHEHEHDHDQEHGHERDHDHDHESHQGGSYEEIKRLIRASSYSTWVKEKATAVFERIAIAEGKIHGCSPEAVHFHEVGAVDSIIDIVGACLALELLGKPRVLAGPVVEGSGWIDCAHGRFPIPAPATLAILGARQIPISQCSEKQELVTPTGAALLAEFAESFGPMRDVAAGKIGYGLGTRENQTRPNVLRAILTDAGDKALDWEADTVAVLETNLDDINAEILGHFVERALEAGALDVFHTSIQMKKNRPGIILTVLCRQEQADHFSELMLRETSAFGVRRHLAERRKLNRTFEKRQTPLGQVTVKIGRLNGQVVQSKPEYESCGEIAARTKKPIKEVFDSVLRSLTP